MEKRVFDFWYAVNHTEVVRLPRGKLETFGNTIVQYHLVSELMDAADKVRIREGRIETRRPEIVTPDHWSATMLEGFGEEAGRYADWLRTHQKDLMLLRYGFLIRKQETRDHVVSESLPMVVEQVEQSIVTRDNPMDALLIGVEEPWEVCLLKLMIEIVQGSVDKHVHDLRRDPRGHRHELEQAFLQAARGNLPLVSLNEKLHRHGLFEEYEDRFFALVRSTR